MKKLFAILLLLLLTVSTSDNQIQTRVVLERNLSIGVWNRALTIEEIKEIHRPRLIVTQQKVK